MRSLLAMSVLAAGLWSGCTNTDGNLSSGDNLNLQLGTDSFTDTKTHFHAAFTDDKGKFRPDWAGGINRPTSHPKALAMKGDDVYSLAGAFDGNNAVLDAKLDQKQQLLVDDSVIVTNEPIVPEGPNIVRDDEAIRTQQAAAEQERLARESASHAERYAITGEAEPSLTMEQMLRIYVDDKGKFRPDWAGGINTPTYVQNRATLERRRMLDNP